MGFVRKKEKKKKRKQWSEAGGRRDFTLGYFGGLVCVFEWQKKGRRRGGEGFKSCLPAGGGSITFEQPHPFRFWVVDFLVILTGVLSSSSGEIKTVNMSANMILLIIGEWNSKLLLHLWILWVDYLKKQTKTLVFGQYLYLNCRPYALTCLLWQ